MIPARQSTALEIAIGPILDADGVAVTGGVVGDLKIKKTTGNFAALNGSATLTHVSAGVYDLVLTTSDTDTVGLCTIAIDDTTNACASIYLQVMEEAVYDMLYAASATGYIANQPVDVNTIKTQTVTCGAGVTVLASVGTAATSTAQTGDTYALANGSAGFVAIDTVVDAIKAKTDSLTFTVANVLDANALRISGSATAADNAEIVFDTDFATAYNTTTDGWNVNATHWGGTAVASALVRGNLIQVGGSATPVTNIGTVFGAVHFADNYDSTNHRWSVNLMDMASSGSVNDVNTLISMLGYYSANVGFAVHGFTGTGGSELQTLFNQRVVAYGLDHLVSASVTGTDIVDNSIIARLVSKSSTADWDTYDQTTDSHEALRDAGFSTLSQADIRTAVGLGSANLDTQLAAIVADTNELQTDWADGGRLDLIVDAILLDTAEIGAAGAGLTNINLPNQTMDIVGNITGNLSGSVGSVTGGINTGAGVITTLDALDTAQDTQHGTTQAKTNNLPSDPADQSAVEAAILAAWTTALTESYSADGAAPTPAQALMLIMQRLTEFAISGTTVTVKKLDGSTTAATLTLNDATSPTSSTRAT